jgi:hypothetical protein
MATRMISLVKEDQVTFNRGMMDHSTFNKMDNIILVIRKIQMFYQLPSAKANHLKWHHQIISKQKINLLTSATLICRVIKKYQNLIDLKKILAIINTIKAFNQAGGKIHKFRVIQTLMKLCNMKFNKNENRFQCHKSTLCHLRL